MSLLRLSSLLTVVSTVTLYSCEGMLNQPMPTSVGVDPEDKVPTDPTPTPTDPTPVDPVTETPETMSRQFFPSDTKTLTPPRLFRLTRDQLRFALQDLFAVTLTEVQLNKLGSDAEALGYTNNASALDLQTSNATSMYELFRELARDKTTAGLAAIATCLGNANPGDTCIRNFTKNYGKRIFRRPITLEEEDRFVALYNSVKGGGATVAVSVQYVIESMLRSPSFLFREEVGTPSTSSRILSAQELASALSAALTRRPPDAELAAVASDGGILDAAQLTTQAQRLVAAEATNNTLVNFFQEWLRIKQLPDIEKNTDVFPFYDEALKAAMLEETSTLVRTELRKPEASLQTLMKTSKSFLKQPLEKVYGVAGLTDTAVETQLDPAQRAGLLTQPSLMTVLADESDSHPIRRGLFVLTRALCQSTPALPRNVNVTLPELVAGETKRQQFARHSSDAACSACHKSIDPFGFGLENLDGVGAFRATERGTAIDVSADIQFLPFSKGQTNGPAALSRFLADAPEFHACFVRQLFRYTMGRQETPGDDPLLRAAYLRFTQSQFNIKDLQLFLVTSDTFTQRAL